MRSFGLSKIFKKYRIEQNRKRLLKNPVYFIDQMGESSVTAANCMQKDRKEIFFYPTLFNTGSDIKLNKLLLILSSDNFFLCNGETATDNKKVIEYQLKLKSISDHYYRECYSRNADYEALANEVYARINSILCATKSANNKRFRISPFFNFWHFGLTSDNWQLFECQLETDDYILVKYRLPKKKHKNYCFNPSLLFGASKEDMVIGINADDSYYTCWLKIGLLIDTSTTAVASCSS
jgi:hypothetical protein